MSENIIDRCLCAMMFDGVVVEKIENDELCCVVETARGQWRMSLFVDDEWVSVCSSLFGVSDSGSGVLFSLLKENLHYSVTRFAVSDGVVVLRADYLVEHFDDDEFGLFFSCCVRELKTVIKKMSLKTQPNEGGFE